MVTHTKTYRPGECESALSGQRHRWAVLLRTKSRLASHAGWSTKGASRLVTWVECSRVHLRTRVCKLIPRRVLRRYLTAFEQRLVCMPARQWRPSLAERMTGCPFRLPFSGFEFERMKRMDEMNSYKTSHIFDSTQSKTKPRRHQSHECMKGECHNKPLILHFG